MAGDGETMGSNTLCCGALGHGDTLNSCENFEYSEFIKVGLCDILLFCFFFN